MPHAWRRGAADASYRSPLQGGESRGRDDASGERRDRHIRVGISHPSGDPARHRVFAIRATFDATVGGWIARIGEENANAQLAEWEPQHDDGGPRVVSSPAACLGDAVTALIDLVDRDVGAGSGLRCGLDDPGSAGAPEACGSIP